jgi:Zn-dependent protease with chaperone function
MDLNAKVQTAADIVFAALGKRYPVNVYVALDANAHWSHATSSIEITTIMAWILSPAQLIATIAHETGHAELGHNETSLGNHSTEYAADEFAVHLGFAAESISLLQVGQKLFGDDASYTHPAFSDRIAAINQLVAAQ